MSLDPLSDSSDSSSSSLPVKLRLLQSKTKEASRGSLRAWRRRRRPGSQAAEELEEDGGRGLLTLGRQEP
jgi:hypothetical protein